MKLSQQEFQKLQAEWYGKLREEGFVDIEIKKNGEWVLDKYTEGPSHKIYKKYDERVSYYCNLIVKLMDPKTSFRNTVDRDILAWHVEGLPHKAIIERLQEMGVCKHRNTIRNIIRRYQWQWKMRIRAPSYYKYNHRHKQPIPS